MNLSYQLYSSRFIGDWEAVLAHLAKTGYAEVEGFMGAIDDPADFRASLDRHGLSMPSIHLGIEDLEADIDGAIKLPGIGGPYGREQLGEVQARPVKRHALFHAQFGC